MIDTDKYKVYLFDVNGNEIDVDILLAEVKRLRKMVEDYKVIMERL